VRRTIGDADRNTAYARPLEELLMPVIYATPHPYDRSLCAGYSPEEVGRSLQAARDWPEGRYKIVQSSSPSLPPSYGDPCRGVAIKGLDGRVALIEGLTD
jgi:hypothetical protein